MFAAVGALALLATAVSGHPASAPLGLAVGAAAIGLGAVVHFLGRRLPPIAFWFFHLGLSALVALAVARAPDAADALAWSTLYVLLLIESFFVLSWLEAGLEFVLAVGLLTLGLLQHPAIEPDEQVLLIGVVATACVAAGCLVRAMAQVETDALTGALNRRGLCRRIDEALRRRQRDVVVALIDLDHFKAVNDTLGHAAGDALLQRVADVVAAALPSASDLARWGGDEFAVLSTGRSAQEVARLLDAARPLLPGTGLSIGVAQARRDDTQDGVLAAADEAMYAVKRAGRDGTRVHGRAGSLPRARLADPAVLARLRVLHVPVLDVPTGLVVGSKVRAVLDDPRRGPLGHEEFLPAAELDGTIREVGRVVLDLACSDLARRPRNVDGSTSWIAVDVRTRELLEPDYAEAVLATLRRHGLPPHALTLDVGEESFWAGSLQLLSTLDRLRGAGVRFAVDDFGSGTASVSNLRDAGLDAVVLDVALTDSLDPGDLGGPDARFVAAVIGVARAVGAQIAVHGIADERVRDWLCVNGCERISGPLAGPALPAAQFKVLADETGRVHGFKPGPTAADH
jgi:diguanylate cyclase (GGDEF)-like protein